MSRVIDAIFKLKDGFSGPMKKCIGVMTDAGKQGKYARKQLENVGNTIQGVGNKVTAVVTGGIVTGLVASTKAAMSFEDSVAKVSTIADESVMNTDDLRKGILDLSNQYGVATDEIAEAQYSAISAGAATEKSLGLVGTALKSAKAGFTDTQTAVDGLTTVYNSFQGAVDYDTIANQMLATQNYGKTTFGELASSMGKVTPIANSLKVSTEDLFSSIAVLTKNGVATSESVTGLKAAYSNILKPTSDAAKEAKKLGLNFSAAHLQEVGWTKFLGEIKTATKGDTEAMSKLFGSVEALNTMTVLAGAGFEDLGNAQNYMKKNGDLLTSSYEKMLTPQERIKQSLVRIKNIGISIGEKLLPYVEKGLGYVDQMMTKFQKMPEGKFDQILKIAGIAASVGPAITTFGKLVTGASKLFGVFSKIKVAGGIVKAVFAGMTAPVSLVVVGIVALIAALVLVIRHFDEIKAACQPVISKMQELGAAFMESISPSVDSFKEACLGLWETVQPLLQQLGEAFSALMEIVGPILKELGDLILTGLIGAFSTLGDTVSAIIDGQTKMIKGITDIIKGVVDFVKAVANGDWKAAWDAISNVVSGAVELITGLIDSIKGYVEGIGAGIEGAWTAMTNKAAGKKESQSTPKNASGTSYWRGGITQVNEAGGEIMDLPQGTRIIPHDLARQKVGGTQNISISGNTFVVREEADIDKITDQLVRKLIVAQGNMGMT